jgi:hypothetical protein
MLASIPGKELHMPNDLKTKLSHRGHPTLILSNSLPLSVSLVSWNFVG